LENIVVFNPEKHILDPRTGFIVDKEHGYPVGIVSEPHKRVDAGIEYPKWVVVHDSHVTRDGEKPPVAQKWVGQHINPRNGEITVLAENAEAEAYAKKDLNAVETGDFE
jgi:hypothetical protein